MTFSEIPAGASVFLDANVLVYHFTADAQFGPPCTDLIRRIERQEILGIVSSHVLSDVSHRLMTIEAMMVFRWPAAGIAQRLRRHRTEIPKLTGFRQAIDEIPRLGVQILEVSAGDVSAATVCCQRFELLSGDGLIVAVMQTNGLTHLASRDADFDCVPGLTRYAPT